jgi:hypothetical protein
MGRALPANYGAAKSFFLYGIGAKNLNPPTPFPKGENLLEFH